MIWIFWEMTSGIYVFSTLWFDSRYMSASVCEGFWKNFTLCLRSGGLWRRRRWTLGDDFKIVFVFSAVLGSTANTCTASVYIGLGISRLFSVKVDLDP